MWDQEFQLLSSNKFECSHNLLAGACMDIIWRSYILTSSVMLVNQRAIFPDIKSNWSVILDWSRLFVRHMNRNKKIFLLWRWIIEEILVYIVNAYPLSNESFNNLAEDSLQTEASLVSKKHLHAILHLQAFQKKIKGQRVHPQWLMRTSVMRDSAIVQL